MKQKYLTYGRDGNTVVRHYGELEKISDNVYYDITPKDGLYSVILSHDGMFWREMYWHVSDIDNLICPTADYAKQAHEGLQKFAKNFPQIILEGTQNNKFVKLLHIRVFEMLGLDTTPLIISRKNYLTNKIKEEQRRLAEIERQKKEAARQKEILEETQQKVLAHEFVKTDNFLALAKDKGFDIHIRTIGAFRKHIISLSVDDDVSIAYYPIGKPRRASLDGVISTSLAFYKWLKETVK